MKKNKILLALCLVPMLIGCEGQGIAVNGQESELLWITYGQASHYRRVEKDFPESNKQLYLKDRGGMYDHVYQLRIKTPHNETYVVITETFSYEIYK